MTAAALPASDLERLLEIVQAHVGVAAGRLTTSSLAAETAGWDSVAMVDVLFAVEESFGVEFTSAQMERADGVASLPALLQAARAD